MTSTSRTAQEQIGLYTPEQRVRRDNSIWTTVQAILAPLQFAVFLVSLVLVLRYLMTGAGYEIATVSIIAKTFLLYLIMVTGAIWEKVVFGQWLFAPAFFWEDVFSFGVIALHSLYLYGLILGGFAPATLIVIALLALGGFALWRWAVAAGSAGTLDWIDARFPRDRDVELAARGNYGPAEAQRAEIWVPEGEAPAGGFPLAVFIHGGGWNSGAPEDYRFVARSLGERGIATALVGYRLVPEGRYPAMLEDSAAGLA